VYAFDLIETGLYQTQLDFGCHRIGNGYLTKKQHVMGQTCL